MVKEDMPNASKLHRAYLVQRWIALHPAAEFHSADETGIWFHVQLPNGFTTGVEVWADVEKGVCHDQGR